MSLQRRAVGSLAGGVMTVALLVPSATAVAQDASTTPASAAPAATVSEACQAANLDSVLRNPGRLTLSTDNPAYPPWWEGSPQEQWPNEPEGGSGWEYSDEFPTGDPYSGQGYESAVSYALAAALGFTPDKVDWSPNAVWEAAFQPGPKAFDWHMAQIAIKPERAEAVDFTDPYFQNVQSLVALAGSDIENATSIADLKDRSLGAQNMTTSYGFIQDVIQPSVEAQVFPTNSDAIQALQNGQIEGLIVDLYSGIFMVSAQLEGGVLVGRFPPDEYAEAMGAILELESPLTDCVNEALATITASGQLQAIYDEWISSTEDVPILG
jgi:polar amino acid transport system substrate-binding protein